MSCCEHRPRDTSSSSIPISPLLLSNQLVVEGRMRRELKPMIQSLILLLHLKRLLKGKPSTPVPITVLEGDNSYGICYGTNSYVICYGTNGYGI
ncbi:unnamed protein product [Lactuca saligna]|uniref:Uncharacterized protein n=1 Tax=Lactuca saligna TaxID=75948 RepID=A0AA36A5I6_LACSI|nr:unnamed protein product [Lactuca saligna]